MPLWTRIANVLRGDRLHREIDEEFESHIEEAIEQGPDPEAARRAFGSAARRREESRDVSRVVGFAPRRRRLLMAATPKEQGDVRCRDPVSDARHGSLHVGIPPDRRPAAAALAG